MNSIKLFENILSEEENEELKSLLKDSSDWRISCDNPKIDEDNGFCIIPYSNQAINNSKESIELKKIGDKVAKNCVEKLNITNYKILRIYYNLYTKSAVGSLHRDENEDNFLSIVYDIDDDGYTLIDGDKIYDKKRQAKVFNSYLLHCGSPPIYNKRRFNLNIILELKD